MTATGTNVHDGPSVGGSRKRLAIRVTRGVLVAALVVDAALALVTNPGRESSPDELRRDLAAGRVDFVTLTYSDQLRASSGPRAIVNDPGSSHPVVVWRTSRLDYHVARLDDAGTFSNTGGADARPRPTPWPRPTSAGRHAPAECRSAPRPPTRSCAACRSARGSSSSWSSAWPEAGSRGAQRSGRGSGSTSCR
jgi:hypothetical protein